MACGCVPSAREPPDNSKSGQVFERWSFYLDQSTPHLPHSCCRCERIPFIDDMLRIEDRDDALEVVASLQTGDILLYQNADIGSLFNLAAMQSSFGHAGIVVELDPDVAAELYPADYQHSQLVSDARLSRLNVVEAVEGRGVCVFPLEARLARCIKYNRYLAVRRHEGAITAAGRAAALEFIKLVNGRALAVAGTHPRLMINVWRLYIPCLPMMAASDFAALSCGELVVEVLLKLGVLSSERGLTSNSVLPTFLTTGDGLPGQIRLEHFTAPEHRFRKELLFLYPRSAYGAHLEEVKVKLAAQLRHGPAPAGPAAGPAARLQQAQRRSLSRLDFAKEMIELF